MAKEANFTNEMVDFMVRTYTGKRAEGATNSEALTAILEDQRFAGKNERSVRAKLSHMKVYEKDVDKPKASKDEGPSKKELAKQLRDLTGRDLDGLEATTKAVIAELIAVFTDLEGRVEADSDEEFEADFEDKAAA